MRSRKFSARLAPLQRRTIYAIGIGLWSSGAVWLIFHYLLPRHGEFGVSRHPLEPWWLALHGGFAAATMWLFGWLWGAHIGRGWAAKRRMWSGGMLVAVVTSLMVSGYLLYYLGDEQLRTMTSLFHWLMGLASPLVFAVHRFRDRSSHRARHTIQVV